MKQDRKLSRKIISREMPGLLKWMLGGISRLIDNNFIFTETEQSRAAMSMMEEANSSVLEYVRENWIIDQDYPTPISDIYKAYCEWSKESGRKPVSSNKFSRQAIQYLGKSFRGWGKYKDMHCYNCRPVKAELNQKIEF
jgi:putative DNA primase/helicase